MHVDRTKFLLLTAAIASACGTSQKPEPAVVKTTAGPDYDTTSGGAATPEPEPENHFVKEEAPPPPPPPPGPVEEGGMMPTLPPPHAATDPKLAKQCASLKAPGPVCESFYSTVESCNRYPDVMVPKAAEAAVKCLVKKSGGKRICEFGVDSVCATEGSKAAKTDASTAQICGAILTNCGQSGYRGKDLSKANCQAALSGYKPEYRNALVSCISEFCEIGTCFYQMR